MTFQELKEYIVDKDKLIDILEELGMHSINTNNSKYISCGMPDGDNQSSTIVYKDFNLHVDAYTRNIKGINGDSDIFNLISFILKIDIFNSFKWCCGFLGVDIYYNPKRNLPVSILWTRQMNKMINKEEIEEPLTPIGEEILNYYKPCSPFIFLEDNITKSTMQEFEIGYDFETHRITIPIRDEFSTLVGVKGRLFKYQLDNEEKKVKYIYLEPCSKTKVLYGLHKSLKHIKEKNEVIVVESEKGVMQLWSYGIRNVVAIGGHSFSQTQIQKLLLLDVENIVLAFDQDVARDKATNKVLKKEYLSIICGFGTYTGSIYALVDIEGVYLDVKESPSDNFEKFICLYNQKFKLKGKVKK